MNQSAKEPAADAPPLSPMSAERLQEQIREHMHRKNQAIFDDMLRERSSTQVPRAQPDPEPRPEPAPQAKPKPRPVRRRRPNMRRKDFDRVLDLVAQGLLNYEISDKLNINKNAVGKTRSGEYRGMTGQQIRRAKRIERDRNKKADEAGCRPVDMPPKLTPAQAFERDAKEAKTLYTLYEGHPLAGKGPPPVAADNPQLSAVSKDHPPQTRDEQRVEAMAEAWRVDDADMTTQAQIESIREIEEGRLAAPPQHRRENGVAAVLELLDRQQRQQANTISDLVSQVRGLLK